MTQPWIPRNTAPWYTVQFFLDSESGDIDEVSQQYGNPVLRCTCSPPDFPECIHVSSVRERMQQGNVGVDLGLGAAEEVHARGLDISDPITLRDLLRRYGHIVVL